MGDKSEWNNCTVCGEGDDKDHKYCKLIEAMDRLEESIKELSYKLDQERR